MVWGIGVCDMIIFSFFLILRIFNKVVNINVMNINNINEKLNVNFESLIGLIENNIRIKNIEEVI